MSRFRKVSVTILIIEILLIALMDIIYIRSVKSENNYYRVEVERLVRLMEKDEGLRNAPDKIDLTEFSTLTKVSYFDSDEICNSAYVVENVGGTEYRIQYRVDSGQAAFIIMNVGMMIMLLVTAIVLIYIGRKVLTPFDKMSDMTLELAKGNLTTPLKEDKNRFFGKFIWGVDLLRENLEDSRLKNLEYQKEKKMLLLSLSHDIKTPLSAIKLYAKALSEGIYDTDKEREDAVSGILTKTDEISNYVDEIHNISREEFMEFDVKPGEFYISDIMKSIAVYYSDKLSVIHTDFIIEEYEDCILRCDKDRLIEAIQNLMENAIKYGDGKSIRISFSEEEDCKLITVSNTGCSLEKSELANIFDSFYRGSNTTNISGNGLGLFIVRQLIRRMDGDVFAETCGDIFKVTLVVRKA